MALALSCERLVDYQIRQKLHAPGKYQAEANIGTAFHVLRLRQLARQLDPVPTWAKEKPAKIAKRQCKPSRLTRGQWAIAEKMWKADKRRRFVPRDWEVRDVEVEIWATLRGLVGSAPGALASEVATSRLDTTFSTPKGIAIVDIKGENAGWSSRRLTEFDPMHPKWLMHWQAAVNIALAEAYYDRPVVGWYAYRIARQEPFDAKLCRLELAPGLLKATPYLIRAAIEREQEILARDGDGVLPTGAAAGQCQSYGGCPYLPLCSAENEDIYQNLLDNDYVQLKGA